MNYSTIIYEKKDRIAKITLNRPDVLNAINITMREEFSQAVDDAASDENIGVLITTGAGRAYSAGMDLKESGGILQGMKVGKAGIVSPSDKIRNLPIPTICAVNGYAVTGGLELAIAHDILIASENAAFADTHARVGVLPNGGASQMLPRLVGVTRAKLASFTGNYISAQEAYHFGGIAMLVPPDELMPTAEKIAQDMLSCNQEVLHRVKFLINEGMKTNLEIGLRLEKVETMHRRAKMQATTAEEATKIRETVLERGRVQKKRSK
ncbi:enoyl-CoA hydratase [Chloroflexota bacterium]